MKREHSPAFQNRGLDQRTTTLVTDDPSAVLPARWPIHIPLVRITTCGRLDIAVLHAITTDATGAPQGVYGPLDSLQRAEKGSATALRLLCLLASQSRGFASRDLISEKLRRFSPDGDGEDDEPDGLKRVDNVVSRLRRLLLPPLFKTLPEAMPVRQRLVTFHRATSESGPGYQLCGLPLIWLDVQVIQGAAKRARALTQFSQDSTAEWQTVYELAASGPFLKEEMYSDWPVMRRQEVETQWWDAVQVLTRQYTEQGEAGEREALRLLRDYWLQHVTNEDALRPLLEQLAKQEGFGQAEAYYAQLCRALEQEGGQPDRRTRETMEFVRAAQIQRKNVEQPYLIQSTNRKCGYVEATLPQIWNVPYQRNPFFTGREEHLTSIHDLFNNREMIVTLPSYTLCGLGGIGKTQTVLEYTYRYGEEYQAVFWLKADTRENLFSDFLSLAALLSLPERHVQDQAVTMSAIKQWLREQGGWLLIFDNADDLEVIQEILPTGCQGHVLLTTRAQAMGRVAHRIEIEEMGQETGALFLLRRARIINPDASLEEASERDRFLAGKLVQELGGLPLALDQAGAYIEETASSLQEYLNFYHTYRIALLQRRGGLTTGHPESVAATWALSFTYIENSDLMAADLLHFCAFLDPDAIPEEILFAGLQQLTFSSSELHQMRFNEAIGSLLRFSLIRRNGDTHTITIHRLIQSVVRDNLLPENHSEWIHRVVHLLAEVFPSAVEVTIWPTCEKFLPHALLCAHWIESVYITSMKAASLLNTIGYYLNMRAQYEIAKPLFQRALSIREQVLGEQHPDTAQTLSNLAYLYHHQDKFEEAMHFLQRSLSIRQQVLGMEHSDTATSLNALALLYRDQGRYEEAEPFFQRALAIRKQTLGTEHLQTAHSLSNLAWLYRNLSKYHEAELLYEQSLTIRKRILGVDHPDTATSFNGLALLYAAQKEYTKAEPLFQHVLTIRKQVLGTKHLHTVQSMNSLALLYRDQGEYEKAEPLFLEALTIREHILGGNHPRTTTSLHNLALLYYNQGKFEQAEPLFQHALTLREQLFGPEHPRTLVILNNLTRCQQDRKK